MLAPSRDAMTSRGSAARPKLLVLPPLSSREEGRGEGEKGRQREGGEKGETEGGRGERVTETFSLSTCMQEERHFREKGRGRGNVRGKKREKGGGGGGREEKRAGERKGEGMGRGRRGKKKEGREGRRRGEGERRGEEEGREKERGGRGGTGGEGEEKNSLLWRCLGLCLPGGGEEVGPHFETVSSVSSSSQSWE